MSRKPARASTHYRTKIEREREGFAMARITVEDCTEKVPNRFHLVQMAAIRTKQLKKGSQALVQSEGNKEVVTALREIAAGHVRPDYPESARQE